MRAAAGAAESATDTLELTGDNVELVLDQVRPEITGFRTQPQVQSFGLIVQGVSFEVLFTL